MEQAVFPMSIMIVLLGAFGLFVVFLLVALAVMKGKPAAPQAGPACSSCGGWTVPQANYCQWCGTALGTAPGADPTGQHRE
jgi:hypothetical protein